MIDGEDKLIQDAVRGEASAFGLLYDRYQPQIYRFVAIKVSHREEAEDLTHQVFLHAWTHVHTYEDVGFPFSSWLYRIARNKVIDHYRTKKNDVPIEDVDEEQFATSATHDADLDAKFTLEQVKNAVRKLKPEYQDVIIMRFVEDHSLKDTAKALEKSEGAIKLMQHRAIKQLQQLLTNNK